MPYTASQHRLFEAAAHDPKIAKQHGISQAEAKKMASEGVKKKTPWHRILKKSDGKALAVQHHLHGSSGHTEEK